MRILFVLLTLNLIILFFFSDVIFGVPVISLFPFFFIIYFLLFFDRKTLRLFSNQDSINFLFISFFLYNVFVYLLNIQSAENLELNYKYINSSKANYLYLKTSLNGLLSILVFFVAYNIGKYLKEKEITIYVFLKVLLILCFANSVANIHTWFISTGGTIGRYNFTPLLVPSQGISIQYSIFGFLIFLSSGKNLVRNIQIRIFLLAIFMLSIIIIFSRQAQILFISIVVLYYYLINDKQNGIGKYLYLLLVPLVLVGAFVIYSSLGLLSLFQQSVDLEGIDILLRIASFNEALRIFYENPVFGTGHGMFALHNKLLVPVAGEEGVMTSPHNGLASIFSELGVIGLFLIFYLILKIYKKVFKYKLRKSKLLNMLMSIYLVYTLSLFFSNFFLLPPPTEYIYYGSAFVFWLLIGYYSFNDREYYD
jgi:O-antigen ligase